MKIENINSATEEAKRFLKVVIEMRKRAKSDYEFMNYFEMGKYKETAALRRASMDLTRALSKMRNE